MHEFQSVFHPNPGPFASPGLGVLARPETLLGLRPFSPSPHVDPPDRGSAGGALTDTALREVPTLPVDSDIWGPWSREGG